MTGLAAYSRFHGRAGVLPGLHERQQDNAPTDHVFARRCHCGASAITVAIAAVGWMLAM